MTIARPVCPTPRCRAAGLRSALLGRASLAAMLTATAAPRAFAGGSIANLPQALAAASRAAGRVSGNTASLNAGQQATLGLANLQAAATRVRTMQQALALQAQGAVRAASISNGLGANGLQPAAGYDQPGAGVWIGVSNTAPVTQSVSAGTTTVTVNQAKPQAVLNWTSFNVGAKTHLVFNQSAGGAAASSWSVLNRIEAPGTAPSQIFGAISAPGQVLVLNPNGVLFGAGAQVSLHSLVAGGIAISDAQYLATGIYGNFAAAASSSVIVEPGASIVTPPPASAETGGGSVLLLAGSVQNGGTIETPAGQTVLAGGTSFTLRTGYSVPANSAITPGICASESACSTVLGTEVDATGIGSATNTGFVAATTGDITMAGQTVLQAGVLYSTTSVTRRGTIHLLNDTADQTGSVTLAPGSLTYVAPDPASPTANLSQRDDTPQEAYGGGGRALLGDQAPLTDQPDRSRIEITTGGTVDFADGSIVLANAGQVAVSAAAASGSAVPGQIFVGKGAMIDVSGLNDVILPMSANLVQVNIQGFQLRDAPVNRDTGTLFNTTLSLDARQLVYVPPSVTDTAARDYTAGGLLEVSGELAQIAHSIAEWSTVGGSVELQGDQVVAQPGATVNIAGGTIEYQAGNIPQTYLIGPGGILYNANIAPANLAYSGIYAGFSVDHARWHITDTYNNPVLTPTSIAEPAYLEGRDAGTLTLVTPTAMFEGSVNAGVYTGPLQTVSHAGIAAGADPVSIGQDVAPLAGALVLADTPYPASGGFAGFPTAVTIEAATPSEAATMTAGAALPAAALDTAIFGSGQLAGLGALTIETGNTVTSHKKSTTFGSIDVEGAITLAAGGRLMLAAPQVTINAPITARSGSVLAETVNPATGTLTAYNPNSRGSLSLGANARIDTRGEWTNLVTNPGETSGAAFVNGGDVALISSGALLLAPGSSIDASAGALVRPALSGGAGGNITLVADDPSIPIVAARTGKPVAFAPVELDATLRSLGVTSGGTFSLAAPAIRIGNDAVPVSDLEIALTPGFFQSGFADYILNGFAEPQSSGKAIGQGVVVQADTQVTLAEPILQLAPGALGLPSGTDPSLPLQQVLYPEFMLNPLTNAFERRAGASITLESQVIDEANTVSVQPYSGITIGTGASITVDTGQSVTLQSPSQITVLGTITAPSGTIALENNGITVNLTNPAAAAKTSIWIGSTARLDANGRSVVALDTLGLPVGEVFAGGNILVGASSDLNNLTSFSTAAAYVFVRPGATLTADGASAALDLSAGTAQSAMLPPGQTPDPVLTEVGSAGGTIGFSSAFGIYLDGTMQAASGAPGVAAGELAIRLEDPTYAYTSGVSYPAWTFNPHDIVVSETTAPSGLPAGLTPGDSSFAKIGSLNGEATISTQQIEAGGFGSLLLLARDQIVFTGSVALTAKQSIVLADYTTANTAGTGSVTIAAPYVLLAGAEQLGTGDTLVLTPLISYHGNGNGTGNAGEPFSKRDPCIAATSKCAGASLTVDAGLIDIEGTVYANGAYAKYSTGAASVSPTLNSYGYNTVDLVSAGDIRFAPASFETTTSANPDQPAEDIVSLITEGDLTLDAARIYPATGVKATVAAGVNEWGLKDSQQLKLANNSLFYGGRLSIGSNGASDPGAPLSLFGVLDMSAATIVQDGNLYAPLGQIQFGVVNGANLPPTLSQYALRNLSVTLGDGSVTSVSAAGLTVPFGGTTDGTSYSYDGQPINFSPASLGAYGNLTPEIHFDAPVSTVDRGATLDLRGGGTLTGGTGEILLNGTTLQSQGFISGRGGSTDTLVTPFLSFNAASLSVTAPTLAQDPIYAIVPSYEAAYAPVTSLEVTNTVTASGKTQTASYYGSLPGIGEQITIGAGVPGLAAGTYTLLPSTYALLPGAFRVQLANSGVAGAGVAGAAPGITGTVVPLGNGTVETTGKIGYAGSGLLNVTPSAIYLTPAATVQDYAQYDRENYAGFAIANAALFGNPRPFLPEDAGSVIVSLELESTARGKPLPAAPGYAFSGTALTAPDGGYGAVLEIVPSAGGELDILGAADSIGKGAVGVDASAINALNIPAVFIGDKFGQVGNGTSSPTGSGASTVVVDGDVQLAASALFLIGTTGVTVNAGASLSALGGTFTLPDSSTGVLFDPGTSAVLALANGSFVFPAASAGKAQITLGACPAGTSCDGLTTTLNSSNFLGLLTGGPISIAPGVVFGARDLEIDTDTLTIGSSSQSGTSATGTTTGSAGATLTQAIIDQLIAGDPAANVPALQTLSLLAGTGIDFLAGATLDAGGPGNGSAELSITTPAIFGQNDGTGGPANASITTGTLVWNGIIGSKPATAAPTGFGDGTGVLSIDAAEIIIGYPALSQAQNITSLGHTIAGFGTVSLTASQEFSANNAASLTVYQCLAASCSGSGAAGGAAGLGGALTIDTPLITTAPGAVLSVLAGGAIDLANSTGAKAGAAAGLGGEIDFTGASIADDTTIALPSGKLSLLANGTSTASGSGDILLGAQSVIDLSGPAVTFLDQTRGSFGGNLDMVSQAGNITQEAGGVIDIAAADGNAGTLSATARGTSVVSNGTTTTTGTVTLGGTLEASAPSASHGGSVEIVANTLGGDAAFAALNQSLDAAGANFARSFEQTGSGSLAVLGNVTAQHVSIAVDGGDLSIAGTIDASGANPGTIVLAAKDNLVLQPGSVLDARETALHMDQYGELIAAENQPLIVLQVASNTATTTTPPSGQQTYVNAPGVLTIDAGANILMQGPDGLSLGTLTLDVPRSYDASFTPAGANIEATGAVAITGAAEIDVNAFRTYQAGNSLVASGGFITPTTMAAIDADNRQYMDAMVANGALTGPLAAQLSGLTSAYADVLHLRPGVEIDSTATGGLTVSGKIDFYQYRYASINSSVAQPDGTGAGEPGVLWLRAAGDLTVNGDLSDGFAAGPTIKLYRHTLTDFESLAPLLAAGDLSWSYALVAGADLGGADSQAVLPADLGSGAAAAGGGNLTLSNKTKLPYNNPGNAEIFVDYVRTGTGSIALAAGGNFSEASPYGIYTAGTGIAGAPQIAGANFTTGGGDVSLFTAGTAQGFVSAIVKAGTNVAYTNTVSDWLQQDGTAWWTSYGSELKNLTYAIAGFGTFGGGNVSLTTGGDAGVITPIKGGVALPYSTALDITIGTTGYVDPATGSVTVLGGGDITVDIGGRLNPGGAVNSISGDDLWGAITDLRGNISITAGAVGQNALLYLPLNGDPRPVNPYVSETDMATGGPTLVTGDSHATMTTRGDLVLAGVGDGGGLNFSFYAPQTSVQLFSAGGDVVPTTIVDPGTQFNLTSASDPLGSPHYYFAPIFDVVAASGDIFLKGNSVPRSVVAQTGFGGIELAPSPDGALDLLAGNSIYDGGGVNAPSPPGTVLAIEQSGAPAGTPGELPGLLFPVQYAATTAGVVSETASGTLHANDPQPSRFYAVLGDIVGLETGQVESGAGFVAYHGGTAVRIIAGNDIVGTGGVQYTQNGTLTFDGGADFFLNNSSTDLSLLQAGNDIIYANADVAGPGTLMVMAGGNVYQGDEGVLLSLGEINDALTPLTRESGAGITVLAGLNGGYDPAAFAALYLNPANLANPTQTLQDRPGKVVRTYQAQLLAWLQARGYTGDAAGALGYFLALPEAEQTEFLLTVYFAELNQSGLDYNNAQSRFYHSYLEGEEAVHALFPATDKTGKTAPSADGLTLFSGISGTITLDSAIRTEFGGSITTVVPYGATTLGNYGIVPQATAGILTQGSGDISMYSYGSVTLGQSRVLTTLGGNVLIWMSSDGEINAGRGSKTTALTPPPNISYDSYGNIFLSSTVPSSGAGIGALAPIVGVPAGDVNLIAPFGTIDAGEAGVRASGNINVAALTVVNSANLQSGGKTSGVPTISGPSAAAVAAASSASASAEAATQQVQAPKAPVAQASIIDVEVSVIGGTAGNDDQRKRKLHGA